MRINVKTIPNAKKEGVEKREDCYIVRVNAQPEKGKANKEVIKLLEKHFGAKVRIIKGANSRKKVCEI